MGLLDDVFGTPQKRARKPRKPRRFTAERIRLNQGGYDRRGRYWGNAGAEMLLYRVIDNEEGKRYPEQYVRAPSAKKAIAIAVANPRAWK